MFATLSFRCSPPIDRFGEPIILENHRTARGGLPVEAKDSPFSRIAMDSHWWPPVHFIRLLGISGFRQSPLDADEREAVKDNLTVYLTS